MPNPLNKYGIQKLEAEKKVLSVTDENLIVLRVTLLNVIVPKEREVLMKILQSFGRWFKINTF